MEERRGPTHDPRCLYIGRIQPGKTYVHGWMVEETPVRVADTLSGVSFCSRRLCYPATNWNNPRIFCSFGGGKALATEKICGVDIGCQKGRICVSDWMSRGQVPELIKQKVNVTQLDVALAKDFVLKHFFPDTEALIINWLNHCDATMPERIHLHQSMQPLQVVEKAARSISVRLACCEAIWSLISSGHLIPGSFQLAGGIPGLPYTTVLRGSGDSGGVSLVDIEPLLVPQSLRRPPSRQGRDDGYLFDGDLYLAELDIPDLHQEVKEALRDAVACFRAELFTPCVAMLGKASEGAWIELGLALCAVADSHDKQVTRTESELLGDRVSVAHKILAVVNLYARKDLLQELHAECKVDIGLLHAAAQWSDLVRDSRNTVHYLVRSATRNSADKVSVLLINASSSLRTLYTVLVAAKALEIRRTGRTPAV